MVIGLLRNRATARLFAWIPALWRCAALSYLWLVSTASVHAGLDYRVYGDFLGRFPEEAITGNIIRDFLRTDVYPDSPTGVELFPALPTSFTENGFETSGWVEWPQFGPRAAPIDLGPDADVADNYAVAVSGILYPPRTGEYVFYIRSDDSSRLYLNPAGPEFLDPVDETVAPIVEEIACCGRLRDTASAPIFLTHGNGYAFEVLFKEWGGADYFQIGWSHEGGPIELINAYYAQRDVRYGAPNADGITAFMGTDAAPIGRENQRFSGIGVEFDRVGAATIQWRIDRGSGFVDIAPEDGFVGYHSPLLSADNARLEWDGLAVRPVVDGIAGPAIVLTVRADETAPEARLTAVGSAAGDRIRLETNEPLDSASAMDPGNYQVGSVSATSVTQVAELIYLLDFGDLGSEPFQVIISGVSDQAVARNALDGAYLVDFRNPKFEAFVFENQLPRLGGSSLGGLVQNIERLRGRIQFPDRPSERIDLEPHFKIPQLDTLLGPPNREDFAIYTSGFLVIGEEDDYTFAISSDDSSAFYLSADDSLANLPELNAPTVYEPQCCEPLGAGAPASVETVHLSPGRYAFTFYGFEFLGGDHFQVGWRRDPTDDYVPILVDAMIQYLDYGELSFSSQPKDASIQEREDVAFAAKVTGSSELAIAYQWLENGAPIPGATSSTLELANVEPSKDGNRYELLAYNTNGAYPIVTSAPATLSVTADAMPPEVTSVRIALNRPRTIEIRFNERVDRVSAESIENYVLTHGLAVESAALQSDDQTVLLTLESLPPRLEFTLAVESVMDTAATPNVNVPSVAQLTSPWYLETFDGLDLGPSIDEALFGASVWTETPPEGWVVDDSGVTTVGDPTKGVTEWEGWAFVDKDWWATGGGGERDAFVLGRDVVAVVDIDEWADKGSPNVDGAYEATMTTGPISIAGAAPGSLSLQFDSSYRSSNSMRVTVEALFDDLPPKQILRWDAWNHQGSPFYKPWMGNETIIRPIGNPTGANVARLRFRVTNVRFDLRWAIDNIAIVESLGLAVEEKPQFITLRRGARSVIDAAPLGAPPFEYQWWRGGAPLPGQTGRFLGFPDFDPNQDAGVYQVDIQSNHGALQSRRIVVAGVGELVLLEEDFEGLALEDTVDEPIPASGVWTKAAPDGWATDDSGVSTIPKPGVGLREWEGWSFADVDWWRASTPSYERFQFKKASGVAAISDPNRWGVAPSVSDETYRTDLISPPIDIRGILPNTLALEFDSCWSGEGSRVVSLLAQFDAEAPIEVFTWGPESPYRVRLSYDQTALDERVVVPIDNPDGAESARLIFRDGDVNSVGRDWWAIDNVRVTGGQREALGGYASGDPIWRLRQIIGRHESNRLAGPSDVAYDITNDRIIVSSAANHRVLVFDTAGRFLCRIGEYGRTPGALSRPESVAVDSGGAIYVCDPANGRVQLYNPNGAFLDSLDPPLDLKRPMPLAVANDASGQVYALFVGSETHIDVYDNAGSFIRSITLSENLEAPVRFAVDSDGDLALTSNGVLKIYHSSGALLHENRFEGAEGAPILTPVEVAYDADGRLYMSAEGPPGAIYEIDANATILGDVTPGEIQTPTGLVFDAAGALWVSDFSEASVSRFAGLGDGDPIIQSRTGNPAGQFYGPNPRFVFDASGKLFVVDQENHRVQAFSTTGAFGYAFGALGGAAGQFNEPKDIAMRSDDSIAVLDTGNQRVQIFSNSGVYLEMFPLEDNEGTQLVDVDRMDVADNGEFYVTTPGFVHVFGDSGDYARRFETHDIANAVDLAVGPNGAVALSSSRDPLVGLYDAFGGRIRIISPSKSAQYPVGIDWLSDTEIVFSRSFERHLEIVNIEELSRSAIHLPSDQAGVGPWTPWNLAVGPDGQIAVSGADDHQIYLLEQEAGPLGNPGFAILSTFNQSDLEETPWSPSAATPDIGTLVRTEGDLRILVENSEQNRWLLGNDESSSFGPNFALDLSDTGPHLLIAFSILFEENFEAIGSDAFHVTIDVANGASQDIHMNFGASMALTLDSSDTVPLPFSWINERLYECRIELDREARKISVWINGAELLLNHTIPEMVDPLTRLQFASNGPSIGVFQLDDIRVIELPLPLFDLDGDARSSIGDVIRFNNFLYGPGSLTEIERQLADLDGNGVLDVLDLELLILEALE